MYKANIHITRRPSILDPQGKAAQHALDNLGYGSVEQVRIGQYVELWIDEESEDAARRVAEEACEKLLANPVMDNFTVDLEKAGALDA